MVIAVRPETTTTLPPRELEGEEELLLTGSEAIAQALRLADVDIVAAYPIRPYDAVMQAVATMIADGKMDCEYIVAEGEHSQFEIVKHASAVGARSFVGSSGVGWFYAFEAIAVTAGLRLPVVANVGNRALDDPGAFGGEHRWRLPDPFAASGQDPAQVDGRSIPAEIRPRRSPVPSRQPDHDRAAGRPGLADRDSQAERRGHAPGTPGDS